jgi:hypothetical protein
MNPVNEVQVSVLVAMPSPRSPSVTSSTTSIAPTTFERDEIPHVVLGIAQVPYALKEQQ